eukprot:620412_1
MSHPTIAHRMERPKEEKHGPPNYDQSTVSCHAKEEEASRKGDTATKRGKSHQKAYSQRKAMKFNGRTNWTMCLDPPSHSTRCKVTGIDTSSRQRSNHEKLPTKSET